MLLKRIYLVNEVFGISTEILEPSYVDRGALDHEIRKHLARDTHIALKGESKCGKSWLRKRNIPDAIVVQCRNRTNVSDIYIDALSQLGIKLTIEYNKQSALRGTLEAVAEGGANLLAKFNFKSTISRDIVQGEKYIAIGHNISDLRYIAEIINNSGRRLVIEDFHYLSSEQRESFAFDLKALWDYRTYIVIIGIWAENNLLLHLNPDLSARVHELSIFWSTDDLHKVIALGATYLEILFTDTVAKNIVDVSFGTVGILQKLIVEFLDQLGISETQNTLKDLSDVAAFENAAMHYAEQLNAVYHTFANRVAKGIRTKPKSTGIYAHMLAIILEADNNALFKGLPLNDIFLKANKREPRITKGNLRLVLKKLDNLQIDDQGRGLILTYDSHAEIVTVVDKQLLLYRKFATLRWPWEELIAKSESDDAAYDEEVD